MAEACVWQRSSFSGEDKGPNCVEVAAKLGIGTLLLRESDDPARVLSATPAGLAALIRHIRAGQG